MQYCTCFSFIHGYSQVFNVWIPRVKLQIVTWIGRGGTISWPQRPPHLTTLDFSVCG